jgi:hypothetical protein
VAPLQLFDPLRIKEHLHGHLAWLSAVALVHPAILLRRTTRRAHLAVGISVALVTAVAAIGLAMYDGYREKLRRPIFASSMAMGYLFERKEHLAFGAVAFAWIGAIAYAAAIVAEASLRESLRRVAYRGFVISAVFAVITAVLGTIVASYHTF